MKKLLTMVLFALWVLPSGAQEKDVFNYMAQKEASKDVKKIVFVADPSPHGGPGNHEFMAGSIYMARTLNASYKNVYCVVYPSYSWPKELSHADAVIVLLNHGGSSVNPAVKKAMENKAGFMAVHYGVEVSKGEQGKAFLNWIGGYFEAFWSVNPHWVPGFDKIPEHETTRGVKPFSVKDEWYYHMRFVDGMKGVTPILSAVPELKTLGGDPKKATSHGNNPDVFAAVSEKKVQHMAWAYNRPEGGRGFGFTGYHNYSNMKNDSFRTLLLNAAAWTAGLEVPQNGIASTTPTDEELDTLFKEALRYRKK